MTETRVLPSLERYKIIQPRVGSEPERAQIAVDRGDDLYNELRIENTLIDDGGNEVQLKQGPPYR